MGISPQARALDRMNRYGDLLQVGLDESGKANYYDARDNAATHGERQEVILDAFESVIRYQHLGIKNKRALAKATAEIQSPSFQHLIERTAEKEDKASLLARAKLTFINQTAGAAGKVLQTLDTLKTVGALHEQMQADLARLRNMPNFSEAVAQFFDDIVNRVSETDAGISLLLAGGSRDGRDIWNAYIERLNAQNQPLPNADRFTLGELASAVLAANRDLRNEMTSLNLVTRDIIAASEVNQAGRKLAEDLQRNPRLAVQRLAKRAANLGEKATRAEIAYLALHRNVQRKLRNWQRSGSR